MYSLWIKAMQAAGTNETQFDVLRRNADTLAHMVYQQQI
jgi:hypothetical protein